MARSWKTTTAGILAIVGSICAAISAELDGNPDTTANWAAVIPAAIAGVGLVMARDNDKTSENVGAGKR